MGAEVNLRSNLIKLYFENEFLRYEQTVEVVIPKFSVYITRIAIVEFVNWVYKSTELAQ